MAGKVLTFSLRFFIIAMLLCIGQVFAKETVPEKEEELFEMPIEKLMEIEVVGTATLTEVKPRLVPAAMTTITEEQIQASGARSLFELLDIYVPNLQWIRHHWESDHLGLRGIINDRDDKYLMLVNGRIMNERTHYGAMSERDLVLLKDIHHIDIVRGPGSSLYGPGAVSMVINIITHNAETFQGTEVTGRLGAVEEFYSGEVKHGHKFKDGDGGVFTYFGIADYRGASEHDAPQIFPFDFPSGGSQAGEPYLGTEIYPSINNDGEAHRNLPPLKLYTEITKGNWDIWGRYTRGGQQGIWDIQDLAPDPWGWAGAPGSAVSLTPNTYGYQQATAYVGHKTEINEKTSLDTAFSYDMLDFERYTEGRIRDAYREDEFYGKILLRWQPLERHKIALGGEYSHQELGMVSPGWPDAYARSSVWSPQSWVVINPMPRWSTNMYSILGEHQWTISDKWTTFLGARLDDHTYCDWMFSPRASVVYTPNKKDTYKVMWSKSVRANFEEEMRKQADSGGGCSNPEKLGSIEFRYERQQSKNLDLAASVFVHYSLELISWNQQGEGGSSTTLGEQQDYGFELEASYHTEKTRLAISHGYTKLYDFELAADKSTLVTAEPYGYGDDLANWSNHITKLTARQKLDERWTLDGSLRIYWGFPGMKDWNEYSQGPRPDPAIEEGWERAYRGNYYMDLGLQYQPNKNLTFRVDGYNLLGVFNKDLNKRNYYASYGDFRCYAPAVGVSVIWLIP
jgi:iron complex outermembrane receptor protein